MENSPATPNPNQAPNPNMLAQQAAANRERRQEADLQAGRAAFIEHVAEAAQQGQAEGVRGYLEGVLSETDGSVPVGERMAAAEILFQEERNKRAGEFVHGLNAFNAAFRHSNITVSRRFAELLLPVARRGEGLVEANGELRQLFHSAPQDTEGLRGLFPVKEVTKKDLKALPRRERKEYEDNPPKIEGTGDRRGYIMANTIRNLGIEVKESGFKGHVKRWGEKHDDLLYQLDISYKSYREKDEQLRYFESTTSPNYSGSRPDLTGFVSGEVIGKVAETFSRTVHQAATADTPKSPTEALEPLFAAAHSREMRGKIGIVVQDIVDYANRTKAKANNIAEDVDTIVEDLNSLIDGYDNLRDKATNQSALIDFLTTKQGELTGKTSHIRRMIMEINESLNQSEADREQSVYHDNRAQQAQDSGHRSRGQSRR